MTHKVIIGETLSGIARAHNVTIAQLLDANPQFRENPDILGADDILNIPENDSAQISDRLPVQPDTPPQPQRAVGTMLGRLSEQFETGGKGPGTVSGGEGDPGGASYGSYQMTSKPDGGTVKIFVSRADFTFRSSFENLTPGSSQFTSAWKQLASSNREEFQRSQHEFIKETHFDLLVKKIIEEDSLNILTRSNTLQDVIWSTAVQHGPTTTIPHLALRTVTVQPDDPDFDRSVIVAVYKERGRKTPQGGLVHFPRASLAVQSGVAKRFETEMRLALNWLDRGSPA